MVRNEPVHGLPRRHPELAHRRVADELGLIGPPRPQRLAILVPPRLRAAVIDANGQVNRRRHARRVRRTLAERRTYRPTIGHRGTTDTTETAIFDASNLPVSG